MISTPTFRHYISAKISLSSLIKVALLLLVCLLAGTPVTSQAQTTQNVTDPSSVKSNLKEILSRPEFQPPIAAKNPFEELGRSLREKWLKFWKQISDRWNNFWRKIFGPGRRQGVDVGPGASIISYIFLYGFITIFFAVGVWLIYLLVRNIVLAKRVKKAKSRTAFDEDEEMEALITEPAEWLRQGLSYLDSKDYRRAYRAVFLAILLEFDRLGVIEFDRSRTNGDYLKLLKKADLSKSAELFRPLVLDFDLHWYGNVPTEESDYRRCLAAHDGILNLLATERNNAGITSFQTSAAGRT